MKVLNLCLRKTQMASVDSEKAKRKCRSDVTFDRTLLMTILCGNCKLIHTRCFKWFTFFQTQRASIPISLHCSRLASRRDEETVQACKSTPEVCDEGVQHV